MTDAEILAALEFPGLNVEASLELRELPILCHAIRELVEAARARPADHISQARDAAIEECAKVCDELMAEYDRDHENGHSSGAWSCARAIRALTTPSDR